MKPIDKAAVVAEIENIKSIEFNERNSSDAYACMALDMVKEAIDTIEMKEAVDAEVVEVEDNNNSIYAYTHLEICTDEI